jgi:hypothetical protein
VEAPRNQDKFPCNLLGKLAVVVEAVVEVVEVVEAPHNLAEFRYIPLGKLEVVAGAGVEVVLQLLFLQMWFLLQ